MGDTVLGLEFAVRGEVRLASGDDALDGVELQPQTDVADHLNRSVLPYTDPPLADAHLSLLSTTSEQCGS